MVYFLRQQHNNNLNKEVFSVELRTNLWEEDYLDKLSSNKPVIVPVVYFLVSAAVLQVLNRVLVVFLVICKVRRNSLSKQLVDCLDRYIHFLKQLIIFIQT